MTTGFSESAFCKAPDRSPGGPVGSCESYGIRPRPGGGRP